MKKTHRATGLLLAALALGGACGCSTVNSSTYTQGAIQSSRKASGLPLQRTAGGEGHLGVIQVRAFSESRARNCREEHNLWLSFIPIACVGTYWERPDWLLWDTNRTAYKPVGVDMAETVCRELEDTGWFSRVLGPDEKGQPDWVLEGDVRQLTYTMHPHLCGFSVFLAPYVGALGVPLGNWSVEQKVQLRLSAAGQAGTVVEREIDTGAKGLIGACYGGNPMQYGYPYQDVMGPVVAELLSGLPQKLTAYRASHPQTPAAAPALAVAAALPASPPQATSLPPPVLVPHVAARPGICWAVVVGVSAYKDSRIPSLRYAASDARAFYEWLVLPSGGRYAPANVKLLLDADATAVNIRQALFDWLQQAVAEDQVTIYFAGHGSPDSPDSNANLFLLPFDTDYAHIAATAFPMWDVETALKRYVRAKRVIVIADACHSAGVGEGFDIARRSGRGMSVNPIGGGLENLAVINEGTCVISASSGSQTSQEGAQWGGGQGVFTHYLLKGLAGDADYPRDGRVTLGKLTQYVSEQVRRATRNLQTPIVSGRYDPSWTLGK